MMFSSLARGTGSWAGEFNPEISTRKYTVTLPEIEPEPPKARPHTVGALSKADTHDSQIQLPKTYITRKGALLLFTAPENTALSERNIFRQKIYNKISKETNFNNFGQKLGTLERLSLSILQFGDEGFLREDSSITDPDSKFFLRFLQTEDDGDLDTRSQPGGDLPNYLRDLKYRASSHLLGSGDTYMPKSREAQELRAILRGLDNNWPLSYNQDGPGRSVIADQFTRPVSCTSARSSSPVSTSGSARQVLCSDKLVASLKSSYCPTPPTDEDSQGSRTPHSGRLLHRRHSAQTRLGTSIKEEGENEGEKKKGKVKKAYWPVTGMMDEVLGVVDHSKDKNTISVAVMGKCEKMHDVQVDGLQDENVSIVTSKMEVAACTDSFDYHTEECREEGPTFEEATDLPDKNEMSVVLEHSFIEDESTLELAKQIPVELHVREGLDENVEKIDVGCETEEFEGDEGHSITSNGKKVQFDVEMLNDPELEDKIAMAEAIEKVTKENVIDVNINSETSNTILQNSELDENSEMGYCSNVSENVDVENVFKPDIILEVDPALDCIAHQKVAGDNKLDSNNKVTEHTLSEEEGEGGVPQAEGVTAKEEPDAFQETQKPQSVIQEDDGEEAGSVIQPLIPQYTDTAGHRPESSQIVAPPPSSRTSTPSPPGSRPRSLVSGGAASMKPKSIREVSGEDYLEPDPATLVSEHLDSPVADDTETELQNVAGAGGSIVELEDVASTIGQESNVTMKEPLEKSPSTKLFSKMKSETMSDMLGITSVQPDSLDETDKSNLIVRENTEASKISKRSVKSTKTTKGARVRFPDHLSDTVRRTPSLSKREMEKSLKQMSEIASSTVSSSVLDTDGKEGLTEEELLEAQEMLKARMSEAQDKMDEFERSHTKKKKEDTKSTKKGKKELPAKRDLSKEKELRKLEKQRKMDEFKALQQKIAEKAANRKAQEDEVMQKSKELEEEMARIQLEADEIEKAEEEARQMLADSRQKQRDEREARRREALEKKKLDALEKREKEKKLLEDSRKKEQEMLERIADAEMRRHLKEEEERKKDEEERLAQEKMEEEMLAARKAAEEEEERLRELEREAEEEAMQRLIVERNEAERRRRELEEERRQMEEAEERKRQIMLAEEMKLQEEQRKKEEEEHLRLEEERRRLKELERLEEEARDQIRHEVEKRRQSALRRREKNLESKAYLDRVKQGQGITKPWVFSYFVKWPRESYERPFGSSSENKNTKKDAKEKSKAASTTSEVGTTLDADTSIATTNT